jgi:hypothetical protein
MPPSRLPAGGVVPLATALVVAMLVTPSARAQPLAVDDDGQDLASICAGERQRIALPPLSRFDENGDRRISEREAEACGILDTLFRRLDLDADEALSPTEYQALPGVWRRRARALKDPADP